MSQEEQTSQISQTKEMSRNKDLKNEEELQPTTVTADYTEAFQSIRGCAVISALIGIHHQVVTSENSKMDYDGIRYPVDTWNGDLSLAEAFRSSCIWYFRKVIDEVGQEIIQEELNKLSYGNCDVSELKWCESFSGT